MNDRNKLKKRILWYRSGISGSDGRAFEMLEMRTIEKMIVGELVVDQKGSQNLLDSHEDTSFWDSGMEK
jgi:hypothetical protein